MDNKTIQFRLNEFQSYQNQSLCDVVLIAERDGTRIHSHRFTLCSASDFFKSLFTNEMKEKDMNEIVLKEVDGDILQQLVEYCHTGKIQLKFENIGRLIASASMYQVIYLENEICTFLRYQIKNENCLSIWSMGRQYNCKDVDQLAFHFACKNFSDVVNCEEFLVLGIELLMELLNSKDLEVYSEEEVFTAIEKWTIFDSVERLQYVQSLVETIRMSDITYKFLNENILGFCMHFEHYEIYLKTYELKTIAKGKTSDRVGKRFLAVGGSTGSVFSIEKYDSKSNSWSMFHEIPANLERFCSEIVGNQLFVIGGKENGVRTNKTLCLSLDCLKHEYKDTMTVARTTFATVVLEDYIYAIGGASSDYHYIPSVERYKINENKWSVVASMSSGRMLHSAVVLSNKIYVVGGYNNGSKLASVEYYNPKTNIWSAVASMNVARHGLSCCVVNGYIYAVGGRDGSNVLQSIERYDEMLDKWIMIDQTLAIPRANFGISIHQNWMYACGGDYNSLEKVNVATGERVQLSSMNQGRFYFQLLRV